MKRKLVDGVYQWDFSETKVEQKVEAKPEKEVKQKKEKSKIDEAISEIKND